MSEETREVKYDFVAEEIKRYEEEDLCQETLDAIRYYLERSDFGLRNDLVTDPVKMAIGSAVYLAAKGLKNQRRKGRDLAEELTWTEKRIHSYEIELNELTKGFHKE